MGNGEEVNRGLNNVFPLLSLLPTRHMKDLLIATRASRFKLKLRV
jgi:hypothetical protein